MVTEWKRELVQRGFFWEDEGVLHRPVVHFGVDLWLPVVEETDVYQIIEQFWTQYFQATTTTAASSLSSTTTTNFSRSLEKNATAAYNESSLCTETVATSTLAWRPSLVFHVDDSHADGNDRLYSGNKSLTNDDYSIAGITWNQNDYDDDDDDDCQEESIAAGASRDPESHPPVPSRRDQIPRTLHHDTTGTVLDTISLSSYPGAVLDEAVDHSFLTTKSSSSLFANAFRETTDSDNNRNNIDHENDGDDDDKAEEEEKEEEEEEEVVFATSCKSSVTTTTAVSSSTTTIGTSQPQPSPPLSCLDDGQLVSLPNGTKMSIPQLQRWLLEVTPHRSVFFPDQKTMKRYTHRANKDTGDDDDDDDEAHRPWQWSRQQHQQHPRQRTTFYFRGMDGLEAWAGLFFENCLDERVVNFAYLLMDRGMLHSYTPRQQLHRNVRDAWLVLQPLLEPHVLNSLVRWTTSVSTTTASDTIVVHGAVRGSQDIELEAPGAEEDAMDVVLRLSRDMDLICDFFTSAKHDSAGDYYYDFVNEESHHEYSHQHRQVQDRFQKFEHDVCELQVIRWPEQPTEKLAFALNLFNLIVRHAMILSRNSGLENALSVLQREEFRWMDWPRQLQDVPEFFSQIGYCVGGAWISAAALQIQLYGQQRTSPNSENGNMPRSNKRRRLDWKIMFPKGKSSPSTLPKLVGSKSHWWSRLSCRDMQAVLPGVIHYEAPVVSFDPRILFAMTWGTRSSPAIATIFPNKLFEGLQAAAEQYCSTHVRVDMEQRTVTLPPLLSWFRADFGYLPEQVLFNVLTYLSPEQLASVCVLRDLGNFSIVFDDSSYIWEPGLTGEETIQESWSAPPPTSFQPFESACLSYKEDLEGGKNENLVGAIQEVEKHSSRDLCLPALEFSRSDGVRSFSDVLLSCFVGRRPSLGDSQPSVRTGSSGGGGSSREWHAGDRDCIDIEATTELPYDDIKGTTGSSDVEDDYCDEHSMFQRTVVSEITCGSEFADVGIEWPPNQS